MLIEEYTQNPPFSPITDIVRAGDRKHQITLRMLEISYPTIYNCLQKGEAWHSRGYDMCPKTIKEQNAHQLELGCEAEGLPKPITPMRDPDAELMRRIDKVIDDTIKNVRPYLNRMVKDVERQLEGSFIRTPGSTVLNDMIEGLEKNMRIFVDEVRALKRWSQPHPPHSSSKDLR